MKFKDSLTKKSVKSLINLIISTMPKRYFTTQERSDEFMLTGDKKFRSVPGKNWTVGFGKKAYTPDDYNQKTYYIAGYDYMGPERL